MLRGTVHRALYDVIGALCKHRLAMENGGVLPPGVLPGAPLPPPGVPQHIINTFPAHPFKAEDVPESPTAPQGDGEERCADSAAPL